MNTDSQMASSDDVTAQTRAAAGLVGPRDGSCTDGGSHSNWVNSGSACELGTDCTDCGPRYSYDRTGPTGDKGFTTVPSTCSVWPWWEGRGWPPWTPQKTAPPSGCSPCP